MFRVHYDVIINGRIKSTPSINTAIKIFDSTKKRAKIEEVTYRLFGSSFEPYESKTIAEK